MTGVVVDIAEDGAEETVPSGIEVALKESSKFSQRSLALFAYPSPFGGGGNGKQLSGITSAERTGREPGSGTGIKVKARERRGRSVCDL